MAEDQEQLDSIANQYETSQEEQKASDTQVIRGTELDVLFTIVPLAYLWGLLGTALSGAALGTLIFPIIGTLFGLVYAAIAGSFTCVATALLCLLTRGRVSIYFAMAWGGSLAGLACALVTQVIENSPPLALIPGLFGAIGARWSTVKGLKKYQLREERGIRSIQHFNIRDIMLATVWLSAGMGLLQWIVQSTYVSWNSMMLGVLFSILCAAVAELIAYLANQVSSS